jgi:hypothetical protein
MTIINHEKTLFSRFITGIFLVSFLWSQAPYTIMNLSTSSRSLALTNGAVAFNSPVLSSNPASLSTDELSGGFHYFTYPLDINGNSIHGTYNFADKHLIGFTITSIDYGKFTDSQTENNFSANDLAIRVGYKSTFRNRISYGISAGFIKSKISSYNSTGLVMNAGIRGRMLSNRLGMGLSIENWGKVIDQYDQFQESILPDFRYSIFYKPQHFPGYLFFDYVKRKNIQDLQIYGIEITFSSNLQLRLSSSSEKKYLEWGEVFDEIVSGLSFGIGWSYKKYQIELASQNLGPAGQVVGFSFYFEF